MESVDYQPENLKLAPPLGHALVSLKISSAEQPKSIAVSAAWKAPPNQHCSFRKMRRFFAFCVPPSNFPIAPRAPRKRSLTKILEKLSPLESAP
jgi:hypothetical protein